MHYASNEEAARQIALEAIKKLNTGSLNIVKLVVNKEGLAANRRTSIPGQWEFTMFKYPEGWDIDSVKES